MTTAAAPGMLELGHGPGPHRMVLLPPAGGGVTPYLPLAEALEPHGQVLAIRALGLFPDEDPDSEVPVMVERYLALLRGLPEPPDVYLGWSLGGVLAWELAARLNARAVIMIDSTAYYHPSAEERLAVIREIDKSAPALLGARERTALHRTAVAHIHATEAHTVTTPFPGDALLISCGEDVAAQWSALAGRLRTHTLPCTHFEAFTEPHLPTLIQHIDEFLARQVPRT